jgi:RHH-type proline utilization regulon transcriptional repressor/proline dehydrogenase/delta 1-pyrroline-5-carboxylate dehydrogenase
LAAINRGKAEATLLAQGTTPENTSGYYCPPTLFGGADPRSFLGQEELFGPILTAFSAANHDEALRLANGVRYALTGGVYSRNPNFLARAKDEFQVGNLYINRKITGAEVDRQPFGGFKLSGIGAKAGGPVYLLQFLTPRTITENTLRRGFAPE